MSVGLFPVASDLPAFRRLVARAGVGMIVNFSDANAAADEFLGQWQTILLFGFRVLGQRLERTVWPTQLIFRYGNWAILLMVKSLKASIRG